MKIALDVDGVLYNWWLNYCNQEEIKFYHPDKWSCISKEQFDNIKYYKSYFTRLPILSEPDEITFPIHCYLTSIEQKLILDRAYDLWNDGYPSASVIASHNKLEYCTNNNIDWLIDDRPKTIQEFKDAGRNIIQFDPYYRNWDLIEGVPTVTSLTQVNKIIGL